MKESPLVNQDNARLPENAFRALKPGESYEPVIPGRLSVPEVSVLSVIQGFAWSIIF